MSRKFLDATGFLRNTSAGIVPGDEEDDDYAGDARLNAAAAGGMSVAFRTPLPRVDAPAVRR